MSDKRIKFIPAILVAGSLFIALSAGCGTRIGPDGDPNATEPPATANPTPTPAATESVAPTPIPTPVVPTPAPELTASTQNFKKGTLFGWLGKSTVDVLVSNNSGVTLSGTVKLTFTSDGSPTEDLSREVSLGAGQTQTLNFKATKKNPDDATVAVTTNQPIAPAPAAAAYPGTAGYPAYPGNTAYYGR